MANDAAPAFAAVSHHRAASDWLCRRYRPDLKALGSRFLGDDRHVAEDVVQELLRVAT